MIQEKKNGIPRIPVNPETIKELLEQNLSGKYFSIKDLKFISCGNNGLNLRVIDYGFLDDEPFLSTIQLFGNTERMKKFLPNLDFSSKEKIQKFIWAISEKTEKGWEFGYTIRINNGVVGVILVSTPLYNKAIMGFPEWTMDFFVFEPFEGNKIMKVSLLRMLYFLQSEIGVNNIYVSIDQDNERCLKLISSLPFNETDNSHFINLQNKTKSPRIFKCSLSTIKFV